MLGSASNHATTTKNQRMQKPQTPPQDGEPLLAPATKPVAELRDVTKVYLEGKRRRVVLEEVDLRVPPGELLILLGRSGSGKSTVLNLLAGIDPPTTGEVLLGGEPLNRMPERERTLLRRDKIGFIFQFFNLIPTLTVEENVLLPLELSGRLNQKERRRALDLLDTVGLGDRRASFPDVLSGGEQQRVAIARALAHDPLLLLADEPTGNLDLETAHEITELLERSARDAGKTLIVATHSREVAALGLSRGAAGLAGAGGAPFRVWLEDWSVESTGERDFPVRLRASGGDVALDLTLDSRKPPVFHGDRGLSRKGAAPGNASYYYSLTRLGASGTLTTDGRELMVFQLRLEDGGVDPVSHGTLVAADGSSRPLELEDFRLEVQATWRSPRGAIYPAGWRLDVTPEGGKRSIPSAGLELEIQPLLAGQELDVSFRYWEGAVTAHGTAGGEPVTGHGYVELVGYGE